MTAEKLFHTLDLDNDGALSRDDLHGAARRLLWDWQEAPLYAFLDLMTAKKPLGREEFVALLEEMGGERFGPYGEVLRKIEYPPPRESRMRVKVGGEQRKTAVLIIDPQRAFTQGVWMQSMGADGDHQVEPIRTAFKNCGAFLAEHHGQLEWMFTRCPFPPGSYAWDPAVEQAIDPEQLYFIKPGNSVLWPRTNGFETWVQALIERGIDTLVMGGCTLNSCVRVSAIETQQQFIDHGFQVVVDLSLCGARAGNYRPSSQFQGLSSVKTAIREMTAAGVEVEEKTAWS